MKKIIPLLIIGLAVVIVSLSTPVYSNPFDVAHATTPTSAAGFSIASSTPALTYGFAFNLENGATKNSSLSVASSSASFTFNADGTKLYVAEHSTDKVFQYSLTTPFDVTDPALVSLDGSSFTFGNEENVPRDIAFSTDGLKFYVIGIDGVDFINQYTLNVAFDLTQGATHDGAYQSPPGPESMAFSADGFTMFVLTSGDMNQYALTTAFDITGGVSYSGTFNPASEGSGVRSIVFDPTGTKLFIYNRNEDEVNQFSLSTPFVITSGVTFDNVTYDIADVQDLSEIEFSADGTKMFHLRSSGDLLIQYDLNVGGFSETAANTGEVEGSLTIQIDDETFTNAGGSLEHKTEYSISNLPLGLDPSLVIAVDGLSATLTMSGSANDHQEVNDVGSLSFNFTDAAFTGGDASSVTNAVGANSEIGVGFEDNFAGLSYGYYFDLGNGTAPSPNPLDISDQVTNALSMVFSTDGTKLFILDDTDDAINQYTLSSPYDITSTVTFNGSYTPTTIVTPKSITFRDDGLKLFVVRPDRIYQYALNTAFDLTQGVTEEGDLFIGSTNGTQGMIFSDDGKIMFLAQTSGDNIQQYHLGIAYDITQGGSFGVSLDVSSQGGVPTSMSFNATGTKIFVLDAVEDEVFQYSLTTPFSFQDGGSYDGVSVDVSGQETLPSAIAFDSDGDKMFLVGRIKDEIIQYDINLEDFEENVSNMGQVDGSLKVSLYGDTFTNAGGTLTFSTDYNIPNLPAGLVPGLAVAADGLTVTLTFSGTATNHQTDDDVANLQLAFEDPAFTVLGADVVENSTSGSGQGLFFIDNPTLTYGNGFAVADAVFTGTPFSVSNEESQPQDLTFSNDGSKMFVVGSGSSTVKQYALSSPFDINSNVTFDGNSSDLSSQEEFPKGIVFNGDGSKFYTIGAIDDNIDQYSVAQPYDVTSTIIHEGSHFVRTEEAAPTALQFNADGSKVYIIGIAQQELIQYSLATPFDITSGVALDGSTSSLSDQETQPAGFAFNNEGTKLFTVGPVGDDINEYNLSTPFDITGGLSFQGVAKSISGQEFNPSGFTFSTNGGKMYVIGTSGVDINQYDIDGNGFAEVAANDGSVSGNLALQIVDDLFTNAGGTLSHGVDYSINNLPSGLTPIFTVAGDGLSAVLTLSNSADNHENLNDVSNLQFTFMNTAFTSDNASAVLNAVNAESEVGINFNEAPIISYGKITSQSIATFDGSYNVQDEESTPTGSTFSSDGLRMFMIGDAGDAVYQYILTRPFDIRSGVTYDGSPFSFTDQNTAGASITFSNDGTKMFIAGFSEILEYGLSIPFDVVNGVVTLVAEYNTFRTGFLIESNPRGVDFSSDGLKMFVVGANSKLVTQFNLTNPFSLSNGVSVASSTFSVAGETSFPIGIAFNINGTKMYVTDLTANSIPEYLLTTPFDITSGVNHVANRFSLTNTSSRDIYFTPDMSKMFVLGNNPDAQNQYGIAGFIESTTDDGSVSGSLTFSIDGDTFSNAGGTLGTNDYEITNLPTGLVPDIAVAADGVSAILTLSGNADAHHDGDDISNLQFTFENAAFSNVSAADITNATSAGSNFGIEFFGAPSAPTDIVLSNSSIDENEASGTVVGLLTTTDVDAGETYTYTLVSGDGDTDNVSFTIDGDELQSSAVFDFETKDSYSVRINTNDGNGGDFEKEMTISVTNVSEVPTDIELDNATIAENEAPATAVGTLSTTDEDAGETYTYTLVSGDGDTDNASFTIDGAELQSATMFDFETKDSYSVRINTNDGNGGNFEKELALSVADVSEVPTNIELDNTTIAENEAPATTVGTLSTIDQDAGETYTYTLVSGDGDTDNASFTIDGAELQSAEVFDFETKDSYSVRINTNDGNGGNFEKELTIGVTNVSEIPTDIELDNTTIAENEASATAVGTLSTTDEDAGETHTYTLVSGDGDTDNTSFVINGAELQSAMMFDFETKDSYSVRINTDDGNGGLFSKAFTITITDVFEVPTDLSLDNSSIQENNTLNAVVGNLSTIDQDAGETYTYALASGAGDTDNASFNINGSEVRASVSFDFETKNSYSIRIQTNDGNGGTLQEMFNISIDNQAEVPTDIMLTSSDIDESSSIGTTVGLFSTTDQDGGETYIYTFADGTGDTDNSSFSIVGNQLQSAEIYDFETKASYNVRIQTNDGNAGTFQKAFTISVNDLPPGLTGVGITSASIDENQSAGSVVGDLFPLGDEIEGVSFTFSLVGGTGDTNNGLFSILSGQLLAMASFDFETSNQYSIRVMADDGAGSTIDQILLVDVNDVNEAPTDIQLSNSSLQENQPIGTLVGSFSSTDEDLGETHTYALVSGEGSGDNIFFSINGNELATTTSSHNFEIQTEFTIRVESNDGNGGTFEEIFIITIEDVSEAPTNFSLSANTIDENSGINTVVGTLSTIDEDAGETYTYTLVAGSGDTDNGSFNINDNELRASEVFDFETQDVYNVRIQTDDGNDGLFAKNITIAITDVNEAPTDIDLSSNTIDENSVVGTVIGSLSTTDEDAAQSFSYDLVDGTGDVDNLSFEISGTDLISKEVFDFETQDSYSIRLQSSDGNGGTFEEVFTISILDQPASVTSLDLSSNTINENQSSGTSVGSLSTSGEELSGSYTYTLVTGSGDTDNASFSIVGDQLNSAAAFDFETQDSYSVRVKTDDGNGGVFEQSFTISILDVNEVPTDIMLSATTISESVSVGTVIGVFTTEDIDGSSSHTYSLITDEDAAFEIVNDELRSAKVFDFETKNVFQITVRSTDQGGLFVDEVLDILVTDLAASVTALNIDNGAIDEHAPTGSQVGTLTTEGEDLSGTFSYTLVSGTGDDDNLAFTISDDQLHTAQSFNFEDKSSLSIRVKTDDGIGNTLEKTFSIEVLDIAESPTGLTLSNSTIDENNSINDIIGEFSTVDEDTGETHTYSLVDGTGDTDNLLFTISGEELQASASFDFETKSSYEIRVQTDDGNGGSFQEVFTISVADVSETPTDILLSDNTIVENNDINDVIGILSSEDQDDLETYSYTLVSGSGDTDNASFTISGDELLAAEVFDFEMQQSYSIRVETNDGHGGVFEKSFEINITDAEENLPPTLTNALSDVTFDNGFVIGTRNLATAFVDPDGDDIMLSASSDNESVATVDFSGSILNMHEVGVGSAVITVTADDGNGGITQTTFDLTINFVAQAPPTDLAISNTSIEENSPVSTAVGTFTTTDINVYDEFTYSLASGTGDDDNASFSIDGSTLRAAEIFDFETQSSYSIRVRTEDGNGGTLEEIFNIEILDLTDKASQEITFQSIEDKTFGDIAFDLSATASSMLLVEFSVVSGPIEIDGNTVTITGAGIAEVAANQAGGASFDPAPEVTQTFNVEKANQVITVTPIADKLTTDAAFELEASVNSGLELTYSLTGPATISGSTVTLSGEEGTVVVTVSQSGNENYNAAEATESFEVSSPAKSDQTITFEEISDKVFGDDPFNLVASASSGLDVTFTLSDGPVTLDGNVVTITGTGTVEIAASQAGNADFNAATTVSRTFEISKADQVITFSSIPDKLTTDAAFELDASVNTELELTYSLTGPATISGSTVTLSGEPGTVVVTVSQSGNENYNAAETTESFEVSLPAKSDQTITFEEISDQVFGDDPFNLVASASSGLDVTFTLSDDPVTLDGNVVTITGTGTVEITASQAGNDNFNAAVAVSRTFEISKADQVITFSSIPDKLTTDASFELEASVNTGLELTYSLTGPATISGSTVTLSGEPGTVVVTVSQSGNENYNAAEATESFEVSSPAKSDQTITFEDISDKVFGDVPFSLAATSSSDLEVVFNVISGPVTIEGTTVTIIGAGLVEIAANQAGSENFNPAEQVIKTFEIHKADQLISLASIDDKLTTDGPFDVDSSVDSGLELTYGVDGPATIDGTTISLTGATGIVTVTVTQAGNSNYNAAEQSTSFTVSLPEKSSQVIDFEAIADMTFGDPAFDLVASASSGLDVVFTIISGPVSLSGNNVTINGAGIAEIAANQAGNSEYHAAPEIIRAFIIAKGDQVITFDALEDKVFGDEPFAVSAASSAGLDVVITVASGPATLNGNELTITGAGTVVIASNQMGNDDYNPAEEVTQSFNVAKADQQITVEPIEDMLNTAMPFTVSVTVDSGLELTYDIDGPAEIDGTQVTLSGSLGTVTITISQIGNDNFNSASVQEVFEVTEEVTTGLAQSKVTMEVYPNPVKDYLKLTVSREMIGGRWSLMNSSGIRLFHNQVDELSTLINLSEIPIGMYYFMVEKSGKRQILRVIRQ